MTFYKTSNVSIGPLLFHLCYKMENFLMDVQTDRQMDRQGQI